MTAVKNATRTTKVNTLINTHWHPEQVGANEAVGKSGGLARLGEIHPKLAQLADQVGGVGAETPGAAPVGCCAEFDAINQLLNQGAGLDAIKLIDVIRPRTGEVVPMCPNCEAMFGDMATPPPPAEP